MPDFDIGVATEDITAGETLCTINLLTGEVRLNKKIRPMENDIARKLGGVYFGEPLP